MFAATTSLSLLSRLTHRVETGPNGVSKVFEFQSEEAIPIEDHRRSGADPIVETRRFDNHGQTAAELKGTASANECAPSSEISAEFPQEMRDIDKSDHIVRTKLSWTVLRRHRNGGMLQADRV